MLSSGVRLGPYEIVDLLGAGGMGEVYRARDVRIGRLVAVKLLPGSVAADPDRARRFEQEARAAGALNHRNVLTIHDVGTTEHSGIASPFLVTELLEGLTLHETLRTGRLDAAATIDYALQIARGLAAAHAAGIVHRDLKPDNLFITRDGTVKVLDFGLAKLAPTAAVLARSETETGIILGTVGYMAPEQVRGQPIDHRADLFAFGAVLYEMLSGCRAFERESGIDTLDAILNAQPEPLPPTTPSALGNLVRQCLEKDAARRPPTASEVAAALEAIRDGHPARIPQRLEPGILRRGPRSWRTRAAAVAVLAVAVAAAGWWAWSSGAMRRARSLPAVVNGKATIAIVPFESIAADDQQRYFTNGMTEEITSQLSRLEGLRVVSRIAVAPLVAVPDRLARMRRELQVGAVVTGSVRIAQQRVRVNVMLVDTGSKETLWSDDYDRNLEDILAVQSDVATRIAIALQTRLSGTDEDRLSRAPTNNLEAYRRQLQADELSATDPAENRRAIALLREAVRLDPAFALAYADLASRLGFLGNYGDPKFYAEALDAAKQAVAADSSHPQTFHALAVAYMQLGRYPDAKLAFLKALELGPNSLGSMFDLSIAEADTGRFDQSLYWARRAFVLAPNVEIAYYHMAVPLNTLDERDVAARWLREAEQRFPTSRRIQLMLADVEFFHERNPGSITRLERLLAAHGDNQEVNGMLTEQYFITGSPKAEARIEALFRNAPDGRTDGSLPETFRTLYAYLLRRRGQVQRASDLLRIAQATAQDKVRTGDASPEVRMELAAIHALNGQHAEAVRWLQAAHEAGWLFFRETLRDPLFSGLAGDPGFTQAIEQMQRQIATMRARIRVEDNPVPPARPPVDQQPR